MPLYHCHRRKYLRSLACVVHPMRQSVPRSNRRHRTSVSMVRTPLMFHLSERSVTSPTGCFSGGGRYDGGLKRDAQERKKFVFLLLVAFWRFVADQKVQKCNLWVVGVEWCLTRAERGFLLKQFPCSFNGVGACVGGLSRRFAGWGAQGCDYFLLQLCLSFASS